MFVKGKIQFTDIDIICITQSRSVLLFWVGIKCMKTSKVTTAVRKTSGMYRGCLKLHLNGNQVKKRMIAIFSSWKEYCIMRKRYKLIHCTRIYGVVIPRPPPSPHTDCLLQLNVYKLTNHCCLLISDLTHIPSCDFSHAHTRTHVYGASFNAGSCLTMAPMGYSSR